MTADEYFESHPEVKQKFDDEIRNDYWGYWVSGIFLSVTGHVLGFLINLSILSFPVHWKGTNLSRWFAKLSSMLCFIVLFNFCPCFFSLLLANNLVLWLSLDKRDLHASSFLCTDQPNFPWFTVISSSISIIFYYRRICLSGAWQSLACRPFRVFFLSRR